MSTTDEVGYVRRVTENPAAVLLLALIDGKIVGSLLGAIGDPTEAIREYTTDLDLSWLDSSFPIALREVSLVSGDRDLVPSEVADLVRRFDAVAGDWESAAIAYVASRRNTRLLIIRGVSDLVNTERGDAIGALPLFESEAAKIMRSLLDDLTRLVPYVLARRRDVLST